MADRRFIPRDRMSRIRWEESVQIARQKRAGNQDPVVFHHSNCSCGSVPLVINGVELPWTLI